MKKPQALKFWGDLDNSTEIEEVISSYKNRPGYGGSRTLQRYTQADRAFGQGLGPEEVAKLTGWSQPYVEKIKSWWQEFRNEKDAFGSKPDLTGLTGGEAKEHRHTLMVPLLDLRGVGQTDVHDYDLATWYSRPEDHWWPIPKGQAHRGFKGGVTVRLDAEEMLEWKYVAQHLPEDPVWAAAEGWKRAVAADLSARLRLLKAIIHRIEKPEEKGGLGLPVELQMKPYGTPERSAVGLKYAFTICDQVLSGSLGLRHGAIKKEAFRVIAGLKDSNILYLGDYPAISSPDEVVRDGAINFLLDAQKSLVSLDAVVAATRAYSEAKVETGKVKEHVNRLRLDVAFPKGTTCDACRV